MLGIFFNSPCGGKGMSKASSDTVLASVSSFSRRHAGSFARMSIDKVFATAPRPRGCSAPFTHTSNGCARSGVSMWPTKIANSPYGCSIM